MNSVSFIPRGLSVAEVCLWLRNEAPQSGANAKYLLDAANKIEEGQLIQREMGRWAPHGAFAQLRDLAWWFLLLVLIVDIVVHLLRAP